MADNNTVNSNETTNTQTPGNAPAVTMTVEEFRSIMDKLEKSNAGQEKYGRLQFFMSMVSALASVAALLIVVFMLSSLMPQVNNIMNELESTLVNVEQITTDIAAIDIDGLMGNVDVVMKDVGSLVTTSESSISDAMEKLNAIDFDSLNNAIHDLEAVVKPLSSLFGGGRR